MGEKVGPTNDFPSGKISEDDEGGINIGFQVGLGLNNQVTIVMSFDIARHDTSAAIMEATVA